jgi:hypothetical protein
MIRLKVITFCIVAAATLLCSYASADQPQPSQHPEIRFVDFPPRIDPQGTHRHYPLAVGSLVFFRQGMRVREVSRDPKGESVESSRSIDAESTVTRLPDETLIVEPDGTRLHLQPDAIIDRSEPSRNYEIIIVPPGRMVPAYLKSVKPDFIVR